MDNEKLDKLMKQFTILKLAFNAYLEGKSNSGDKFAGEILKHMEKINKLPAVLLRQLAGDILD